MALSIRLFGSMEVRVSGAPLPPLRSRKGLWLLALLVLRHDREIDRLWLAGTLWPDSPEPQALSSLCQSLSDLRRVLISLDGGRRVAAQIVSVNRRTLLLDLAGADVDVLAFDAALERGDMTSLEEAVAWYRGPLLEGCLEEWAIPERDSREQRFLGALETLAVQAKVRGELALSAERLRRVVVLDPLRESSHRLLMETLAAMGQPGDAVQTYRELKLTLAQELDTEPAPETTAVYQRIREQARHTALATVTAGRTSTAVHRRRRLGGRSGKEAHFRSAIVLPDPPNGPPAIASAWRARQPGVPVHNLPRLLDRFIGRVDEREEIKARLFQTPLVTLVGPGGCGKTRLALEVGRDLLEDFPDGAWLADLAPLADAAQVPRTVGSSLGMQEQNRPMLEALAVYLETKTLLLILDNCEHLPAVCAELVHRLMRFCQGLRILATSRMRLGIPGEATYQVPSLPVPSVAPGVPVSAQLACESAELFLDRVRMADPSFALCPDNTAAVLEICRRLDGIPLALELAAGRVRAMAPQEIARRLDDQFQILQGNDRTALPRHRTLRGLIDWSHNTLRSNEQTLLRRLSVFAGGWTVEAAEAVCSGEDMPERETLALLASLVDQSLVVYEPCRDSHRYRLLETVRQYAMERLNAAGEAMQVRERHLEYYRRWVETVIPDFPSALVGSLAKRAEPELDNLRAALKWCASLPDRQKTGLELAIHMGAFWLTRSYLSEGRESIQTALDHCPGASPTLRARALGRLGFLAFWQTDYRSLERIADACWNAAEESGDEPARACATEVRVFQLFTRGDIQGMRTLCEGSLALSYETGSLWRRLYALNGLGAALMRLGDDDRAIECYRQCLALDALVGEPGLAAYTVHCMGETERFQYRYDAAMEHYNESLRRFAEFGEKRGIGFALESLGEVALARAQWRGMQQRRRCGSRVALRGT